jgi:hypothetical protein
VQLTALPSPPFILYIINIFYHFPLIILVVRRPDTSGYNLTTPPLPLFILSVTSIILPFSPNILTVRYLDTSN